MNHGDSLENDWYILRERNLAKKITFDAVVANPPFSYKWKPSEEMKKDFRFKDYGPAPKSAADEERYSRRVGMEEIEENEFSRSKEREWIETTTSPAM